MSLLIHGATVVTSLDPVAVERLDVRIENGRVAALAPVLDVAGPTLDATDCLVIPGNVNAHMHAYSALARGMPYRLDPPTNFLEILQRVWWRLDRALDRHSIRACALVAAREAALAGTTTLVDHHASPNAIDGSLDVLADAFEQVGIRSVLAYEVTDRDGPDRAAAGIAENERFLGEVAGGGHPLARAMVGAHASFSLSDQTLADCVALARDTQTGLHIHVAEDAIDAGAVARLSGAGAIWARTLVAHAVHVDRAGAEVLRDRTATIVHNPRSNMNNGVGRAPLAWLGERVALGTDGIGSDMFAESGAGCLRRRDEDLATPADWALRRLHRSARLAACAFAEPLLGAIAVGAPADLVVLDYAAPTPLDASSLAGHWLFGLSAGHVRDVLVAGEVVVRDRHLARVDEDAIGVQAREQARRLWQRLEDIAPHPFAPPSRRAAVGAG